VAGTLILNTIHQGKITGGASGALRQEFRELELLDDITVLTFENKLPRKVTTGDCRNTLINAFRKYKGNEYIPSTLHRALQWSKSDPFLEWQENVDWQMVDPKSDSPKVDPGTVDDARLPSTPKKQTNAHIIPTQKCKSSYTCPASIDRCPLKKVKFDHLTTDPSNEAVQLNIPLGTQWQTNSCAYDAVLAILFNIWRECPAATTTAWQEVQCDLLDTLVQSFHTHSSIQVASASSRQFSLEQIRDFLRRHMARISDQFAFSRYASVHCIMEQLLKTAWPVTAADILCPNGHDIDRNSSPTCSCQMIVFRCPGMSLQEYVDNFTVSLTSKCSTCNVNFLRSTTFVHTPALLAFDLGRNVPSLDPVLQITCTNSRIPYNLRGVVYFSDEHFTARVITNAGTVWFHDGMLTGSSLLYESQNLATVYTDRAILAIYGRGTPPPP